MLKIFDTVDHIQIFEDSLDLRIKRQGKWTFKSKF